MHLLLPRRLLGLGELLLDHLLADRGDEAIDLSGLGLPPDAGLSEIVEDRVVAGDSVSGSGSAALTLTRRALRFAGDGVTLTSRAWNATPSAHHRR